MLLDTGVSIIMNRWLQVSQEELVLFITDENHLREAEAVDKWAKSTDSVVRVIVLDSKEVQEGKVIRDMADLLASANVVIGATDYSFITTPEVQQAADKGARFLSLPLSCSDGTSLLENDFIAMDTRWSQRVGTPMQKLLKDAKTIHVKTAKGTDLYFDKTGRKCGLYYGMATRRGQIASTSFEAYVPIVENKTEGRLILDASLGYIGTPKEDIEIEFHEGRLHIISTHDDAKRLRDYIESFEDDTMWINGEFGIGLNALSKCRGVSYIEDESTYGTFHIGMGRNISLGGKQMAKGHFDIVTNAPTIYADEYCIMKDGQHIL